MHACVHARVHARVHASRRRRQAQCSPAQLQRGLAWPVARSLISVAHAPLPRCTSCLSMHTPRPSLRPPQPERWLDEATRPRAYATFGAGTHLCLGIHAAYAEAKLLLLRLLRGYEFEMDDRAVLAKCSGHFPGPTPAPGTDGLRVHAKRSAC